MSSENVELLIAIVEATPQGWSPLDRVAYNLVQKRTQPNSSSQNPDPASIEPRVICFPEFVQAFLLFLNAFLSQQRGNQVAILSYNGECGGYVYPSNVPEDINQALSSNALLANSAQSSNTDLDSSSSFNKQISDTLFGLRYFKQIATKELDPEFDELTPLVMRGLDSRHRGLASCLSLSLCYLSQMRKKHQTIKPRIVVFQAERDQPDEYRSIINSIFASQRLNVSIDSVLLNSSMSSMFLEQAALLTRGIHLKVSDQANVSLVQFFFTCLLPSLELRQTTLVLPPILNVDLQAHCFCHHKKQSMAYVCIVCLSIFCTSLKKCPTCSTAS
jgi:transcription initiation factor TFIIH subunit 3